MADLIDFQRYMSKSILASSLCGLVQKMPEEVFFDYVRPYLTLGDAQSYMSSYNTGLSKPEFLLARIEERGWASEKNLQDYERIAGKSLRSEKVRELNLTGSSLSDGDLEGIAQRFPMLEKIVLIRCQKITDAGISALGKKCLNLKKLDCTGCLKLKGSSLGEEGPLFPSLETLILSHVQGLRDEGIAQFLVHCPNLLELRAAGNLALRGAWIAHLRPRLLRLDVAGSHWLRDAMLQQVNQKCPQLKWIGLVGSEEITQRGIVHLRNAANDMPPENQVVEEPALRLSFMQRLVRFFIELIFNR